MSRIPFRLPDVGLNEIEGLVFIDGGQLVIRFGSSLLGLFDTDKDEMRVSPGELEDLRIKHGLFKDRLVVTPIRAFAFFAAGREENRSGSWFGVRRQGSCARFQNTFSSRVLHDGRRCRRRR